MDVVVVGMGAAGIAAALTAHDRGASVVILEKESPERAGGNTRVSGGSFFDNRDPAGAATYLRSLSGDRPVDEAVVRAWAEETARNAEWMRSLGVNVQANGDFAPEYPELPGSEAYSGYLSVDGVMGEMRTFEALRGALTERGIDVRYRTPATRLISDDDKVIGVRAECDGRPVTFAARGGVVLATGGFQADEQMVRDYLNVVDPPLWGTPAATGDGHRMAMGVGADLWHMNNCMTVAGVPAPGTPHGFFQGFVFSKGYIWVAEDGARFVNERPQVGHGQAFMHGRYELFPQHRMHMVFDEATRRAGPICLPRRYMGVGWLYLVDGLDWSQDNLAEIEAGLITRADTLPELARAIGVPEDRLEATVQRWNQACVAGVDEQFARPADTLTALGEGPYYAVSSSPMLGWTNGGPRRNERSQVLHAEGHVIPGLYAAGEISSTYSWSKDGGFHMADALAFGRIAGADAARRAASTRD